MNQVIAIKGVSKHYPVRNDLWDYLQPKFIHAVDDVTFSLCLGETIALLGESSCGKTSLLKLVMGLENTSHGHIEYNGKKIGNMKKNERKQFRKECQMVFQNPYSTFNPTFTIGTSLRRASRLFPNSQASFLDEILEEFKISSKLLPRFPHELSGGELQRFNIARSLISEPVFLALDEPTSALDKSIKELVLNTIQNIQKQRKLSILLVSHDFEVARKLVKKIIVMYAGQLVEIGNTEELQEHPLHPYTKALISAVMKMELSEKGFLQKTFLDGEPPNPLHPPQGCRFHPRCPQKQAICSERMPAMKEIADSRFVACYFPLG